MLKIQITAKAIWNGLFLYLVAYSISQLSVFNKWTEKGLSFSVTHYLAFGFCIIFLFGLRNVSIPLRITGSPAVVPQADWQKFFIQSHRLACILVGLISLSSVLTNFDELFILSFRLFPEIRNWFSLWVEGNWQTAFEQTVAGVSYFFYPVIFFLFCVYLICGADSFIRWQIRLFEKHLARESCHE